MQGDAEKLVYDRYAHFPWGHDGERVAVPKELPFATPLRIFVGSVRFGCLIRLECLVQERVVIEEWWTTRRCDDPTSHLLLSESKG